MHPMAFSNQDEHERVKKFVFGENPLEYVQEVAIDYEQPLCIYVESRKKLETFTTYWEIPSFLFGGRWAAIL